MYVWTLLLVIGRSGHKYFGPLTAFLAMNQLASDGPTEITTIEPVVCVCGLQIHGK